MWLYDVMLFIKLSYVWWWDTYIIILYCDVAFTYRHVCMYVRTFLYLIHSMHQLSLYNPRLVSFYTFAWWNSSSSSSLLPSSIYRDEHHDYYYHNKYHHHLLISTIIILDIIILTIFIFYFISMSHLFIIFIVWTDCSPLGQ